MNPALADALGFTWDHSIVPSVPTYSVERAVFRHHKALAEFVWDASVLEGNTFTYPEVQTLLDGVTVGGHKISDERQVLNLAESAKELSHLVRANLFTLTKDTSDKLHSIIARDEAFDAGYFRGEGKEQTLTPAVSLGAEVGYLPPSTEPGGSNLRTLYSIGLEAITTLLASPFEQAITYFLFGALQQFYFDGNKRSSRYMMNGHLMSSGIDAISVPAARAAEFNQRMVRFYQTKDATEMFAFLVDCHPDAETITTHEIRKILQ